MLPHTGMLGVLPTGSACSRGILLVQSVQVSQEIQSRVPEDLQELVLLCEGFSKIKCQGEARALPCQLIYQTPGEKHRSKEVNPERVQ